MSEPKLSVFLCHSSHDKSLVRELYRQLLNESWIDPWLDEEKLLPGQDWDFEIEKAVEKAHAVIICLSGNSVTKEGYIQRELKFVLDIALEKPEGTIFIIPLRLDDCELPRRLRSWQYVDYFPQDHRKRAHQRLVQSLHARYSQLLADKESAEIADAFKTDALAASTEDAAPAQTTQPNQFTVSLPATAPGIVDLIGSALPILFFAQLILFLFGNADNAAWLLLGITSIVYAAFLAFRRQVLNNRWLKLATVVFIVADSVLLYSDYVGWSVTDKIKILVGLIALAVAGLHVVNFKAPRTSMPYAASLFGVFLGLYGFKLLANLLNFYPNGFQTPMVTIGFIAAIFWWLER